jgi:hypothetical protein
MKAGRTTSCVKQPSGLPTGWVGNLFKICCYKKDAIIFYVCYHINAGYHMGKKILLLITLTVGFVFSSFAQSTGFGNFNLGIYGALPLSNMRAIFNEGIGGSLKYEYHLKKYLNFSLESGYETFTLKTTFQDPFNPSTYSYVPIKIGAKYYPLTNLLKSKSNSLYAEFQAGVVMYAQHGGGHTFDYSPGIGYSFKSGFEIGLRYEEWKQNPEVHLKDDFGQTGPFKDPSNFSQLALRIAERF